MSKYDFFTTGNETSDKEVTFLLLSTFPSDRKTIETIAETFTTYKHWSGGPTNYFGDWEIKKSNCSVHARLELNYVGHAHDTISVGIAIQHNSKTDTEKLFKLVSVRLPFNTNEPFDLQTFFNVVHSVVGTLS